MIKGNDFVMFHTELEAHAYSLDNMVKALNEMEKPKTKLQRAALRLFIGALQRKRNRIKVY